MSPQALKDTSILKSENRNAASLHVDDQANGSGTRVHLEGKLAKRQHPSRSQGLREISRLATRAS
jgi:hypothetical protein